MNFKDLPKLQRVLIAARGGRRRALKMSPEERSRSAMKAARARWGWDKKKSILDQPLAPLQFGPKKQDQDD
jgi:hypothetical protein